MIGSQKDMKISKIKCYNMKEYTMRLFSRHKSHSCLRDKIKLPVLTCIRFGSVTRGTLPYKVEINSPESIVVSANKRLMKEAFNRAGVKTAEWFIYTSNGFRREGIQPQGLVETSNLSYPLIAKHIYGSRGTGNYKLNSKEELESWMRSRDLSKYIFEEYLKGYCREYRAHVSINGEFYTCRKMLRNEVPNDKRWSRHSEDCVWVMPENSKFDKPINWELIVEDCKKALKSIGADVLSFDIKVQSSKNKDGVLRENPKWALLESNSASSLGEIGAKKYLEEIPKIVESKLHG